MSDLDYEEVLTYFSNFDSRKNGSLDFTEFSELISAIGFNLSDKQLREGFDKIDTDNNNEIDLDEFMAWWGEKK
ncbi:MAG: EF-hand domain-containing protein [Proteobacteria bacterium]|nr:EF-hand domain-containing protein [Pseudomonadota bacterium]NOG61250.1 EF-hand domain-containing protein [Pseudomonadota bacterium]